MKIKFYGRAGLSLMIISLFILPTLVHAEKQKIRVVVENASIRMQPNMESEVIENPPVGSVFEVERKIGEWYEVRYQSKVGVRITGYIHEMLVEAEKATPAPARQVTPQPTREPVRPTPPPRPMRRQPPKIMFNLGAGGLVNFIEGYDWEYSFSYLDEQASYTDSAEKSMGIGFDLGFGIFVMPNIEITGGLNYLFPKSRTTTYVIDLPSEYFYNDNAQGDTEADTKYSAIILNFGLNFHPVTEGSIRPYLGAGISYIMAKMELMDDLWYIDHYDGLDHTYIEITEVELTEESLSKLGFNIRAGANLEIADNIFIFGEARYIIAKKTIPHPLIAATEEMYNLDLGADELEINLGGVSIILGVKIGV